MAQQTGLSSDAFWFALVVADEFPSRIIAGTHLSKKIGRFHLPPRRQPASASPVGSKSRYLALERMFYRKVGRILRKSSGSNFSANARRRFRACITNLNSRNPNEKPAASA
jgi:hypothetical protein